MDTLNTKLVACINQAIGQKLFPGCVVGVVRTSGQRLVVPVGHLTFELDSAPVVDDTIYDVASITKSIPTSSLALLLLDEGKLALDDRVIDFVPELHNTQRDQVLIRHLLTQTLNFDFSQPLSALKNRSASEILEVIFATEFKTPPGHNFFYVNATSILLGLVVSRIFKDSLDRLGRHYFFEPLGMTRTSFRPLEKFKRAEIAPSEVQAWRGGLVRGEIHDESAHILSQQQVIGSAGLFSTVPDLLNFLEMLLHRGSLKGRAYFSPEMVAQIETNQIGAIGKWAGLGWELNQPRYMGAHCRPTTFGKTGFTGCTVVCDINAEVACVILSNYMYPERKDPAALNDFRRAIADIVFENV